MVVGEAVRFPPRETQRLHETWLVNVFSIAFLFLQNKKKEQDYRSTVTVESA